MTGYMGWISVSIRSDNGHSIIVDPGTLAGREVLSGVDAEACLEKAPAPWDNFGGAICGLVKGHEGDHWICSPELVEEGGPFMVLP